jgi:hypothetical protein
LELVHILKILLVQTPTGIFNQASAMIGAIPLTDAFAM